MHVKVVALQSCLVFWPTLYCNLCVNRFGLFVTTLLVDPARYLPYLMNM